MEGSILDLKPMSLHKYGSAGSQLVAKCRHCQQLTAWFAGVARVGMLGGIGGFKQK